MPDQDSTRGQPGFLDEADFVSESVPARPPRRRPWLMWFLAAAGAVATVCFAGCVVFSFFCRTERLTAPADVYKSALEITDFTLPNGYEGELAEVIDTPLFLVRKTLFRHTTGKGVLLLAEMKLKFAANDDEAASRGLQQIAAEMRRIVARENALKTLTIRGKTADFTLIHGEDALSTTKYHEIRGEFPGKSGRALLWLQAEDPIENAGDAEALLESLH